MSGLPDLLAGLMLVVAAVSAGNLAAALSPASWLLITEPAGTRSPPRWSGEADLDIAYLLMGIAMAGMLEPNVRTLPSHAWEAVFALLAAWFGRGLADAVRRDGLRSLAIGHRAEHMVHCAAMAYMYAALATSDGANMTVAGICAAGPLKFPGLALGFVVVLAGYSVRDLAGHLSRRGSDPAPAAVCRIFMGVNMASMLLMASRPW